MAGYVGRVSLNGSAANATIPDLESPVWEADVREIETFDFQPGLVTIQLLDGRSAGLFAIGELHYPDGSQVYPYREGPAIVLARTPFGPRPIA